MKILTYRWPTVVSGEKYSEVYGCTGNPTSIDPLFFLRCLKLDQIPAIKNRYAHLKRIDYYPDSYLHVAAFTGLEDVVAKLPCLEVGRAIHRDRAEGVIGVPVLSEEVIIFADLDDAAAMRVDLAAGGGDELRSVVDGLRRGERGAPEQRHGERKRGSRPKSMGHVLIPPVTWFWRNA